MSDVITPASAAAGAIAACAYQAGAAIVDPILGLNVDAIVVGFVAGMAVQFHIPAKEGQARTPKSLFALAAAASFFAGVFSPILAGMMIEKIGCLQGMTYSGTRLAASAIIAAAMFGLPILRSWAGKKWGGE